jgi:type III secretion protein V
MMVFPMPTWALDVGLSFNLSLAIGLFVAALTAPSMLDLKVFPVVLVLATIFRLSLNVSSTRLILLDADAGEVIDAFGHFVVGGDYVVGGVIFLIIAFVQYVVVAKGAERVSEVAARFSLDAMPGKQQAIERDVQRGEYGAEDAGLKRERLEEKMHLLGSMDGAMKFVKGDAIAGLFITGVNIVAGTAIGVYSEHMIVSEALRTYGLLTVGDGLISQIPACLIAVTAALLVTDGAGAAADQSLSDELIDELIRQPQAVVIAGLSLLALGVVPQLPTVPFAIAGSIIGTAGIWLYVEDESPDKNAASLAWETTRLPRTEFVSVHVGELLSEKVKGGRTQRLEGSELEDRFFDKLGLKLDEVRVYWSSDEVGTRQLQVQFEEIPLETISVPRGADYFVDRHPVAVDSTQVDIEAASNGQTGTWILDGAPENEGVDGAEAMSVPEYLEESVLRILRCHADQFVTLEEIRARLEELRGEYRVLYDKFGDSELSLAEFTELCRQLVRENISLRRLPRIIRAVVKLDEKMSFWQTLGAIREELARTITHSASEDGELLVYEVDPEIERMIVDSSRRSDSTFEIGLNRQLERDILDAIRRAVYGDGDRPDKPILLVKPETRGPLQLLVCDNFPTITVLTNREIDSSVARPERIGCISMGDGKRAATGST